MYFCSVILQNFIVIYTPSWTDICHIQIYVTVYTIYTYLYISDIYLPNIPIYIPLNNIIIRRYNIANEVRFGKVFVSSAHEIHYDIMVHNERGNLAGHADLCYIKTFQETSVFFIILLKCWIQSLQTHCKCYAKLFINIFSVYNLNVILFHH